ncbi:MAG: pseudouridine synthase [Leptospirales bacterium]
MDEEKPDLPILYRDEHLVAIHKPAGLLVHRSSIDASETEYAVQRLRDQIRQRVYPLHRLDKPTSGVLLFALHPEAVRVFSSLFETRKMDKTYIGVVRGHTESMGTIDYPLTDELNPDNGARAAITRYTLLHKVELEYPVGKYNTARYSVVAIHPETGRRHQIRRHFKHIFHPLIGDTTHGDGKHNRFFQETLHSHRLLLAATELGLVHPYTGKKLVISAPIETSFTQILHKLGWNNVSQQLF